MNLRALLGVVVLAAGFIPMRAAHAQPTTEPRWVWGAEQSKDNEIFFFRKSFETFIENKQKDVKSATLWGTCDNEMIVYLNGKKVAESREWERSTVVDVTDALIPGRNQIAVRGRNTDGPAALILRLTINKSDGTKTIAVTDGTWKTSASAETGWEAASYDDAAWRGVHVVGNLGVQPWGNVPGSDGKITAQATPADQITTLPGFKIELLYSVPKAEQGSWVSMTGDPKGRLIVSGQDGPMYRVTPAAKASDLKVEPINLPIGHAQGLLWANDSLYVTVNGRGIGGNGSGLYRLRDTDGDDQFDKLETLIKINGSGEHGPHATRLGRDGKIYLVAGNFTKPPAKPPYSPHKNYAEDLLLPRNPDGGGHDPNIMAPGGWICRADADGKNWELFCAGLRNTYDIDFNEDGELFTFDSDMEWDTGTPWYRPIRVNLAVSSGEYGWRNGTGKWPDYYPDSLGAVVNTGLGSPTGVTFGYGAKFPAKYQKAFFIQDWSYGKIYAVHMTPDGAGYRGWFEPFVQGKGFPVTDIAISKDGAMYITVGGRGTQSGLYRVSYVGGESTAPAAPLKDENAAAARKRRHKLESFHGKSLEGVVGLAWDDLNSQDRYLRYAARVAIEWQPISQWQEMALSETRPTAAINALIGLIRANAQSPTENYPTNAQTKIEYKIQDTSLQPRIIESLNRLNLKSLSEEQLLEACRAYGLCFIRLGRPGPEDGKTIAARLDALFPAQAVFVNRELSQLLVYLDSPTVISKCLSLLASARTQEDQLHYVLILRNVREGWTLDQRRAYFSWLAHAEKNYKGGASFKRFLQRIRDDAMKTMEAPDRVKIEEFLKAGQIVEVVKETKPRQFVRNWQMQDLLPVIDQASRGRNYQKGKEVLTVAQCLTCHRFGNEGGATGQDLTGVGNRFSPADVLEAILLPNKVISDQYQNTEISTKDKDFIVGTIESEDAEKVVVRTHPLSEETVSVLKKNIVKRQPSKTSIMPTGLIDVLEQDEILDLIAYIRSGGDPKDKAFK
jgi:putative heme-binding domain-containing protein